MNPSRLLFALIAAAQIVPLIRGMTYPSGWPGLITVLTTNHCVFVAWLALSQFSTLKTVAALACSYGLVIVAYVSRNPYVAFLENSIFLLAPAAVLIGCLAGRPFLSVGQRPMRFRFSLKTLLILTVLAGVVSFTESLVADYTRRFLAGEIEAESSTWLYLNSFIFSVQSACITISLCWFVLHQRSIFVALLASLAATLFATSIAILCELRGPLADPWAAVPALYEWSLTFASLQSPVLLLLRWQVKLYTQSDSAQDGTDKKLRMYSAVSD